MKKRAMMMVLIWTMLCSSSLADVELYYNPNGGSYVHHDANCISVNSKYLPLVHIGAADAEELGLKECSICAKQLFFRLFGDAYYHKNMNCQAVQGSYINGSMITAEEKIELGLNPCPYCVVKGEVDAAGIYQRWYDPDGGRHFHRGGTECSAAMPGAYQRRQTVNANDGYYYSQDGIRLLPCGVCKPYGEMGKYVQYSDPKGGEVLHTSVYCPQIPAAYRAVRTQAVPYDVWTGGAESTLELCRICMGVDDADVYAWYNTDGGKKLHSTAACTAIEARYYPYMSGLCEAETKQLLNKGYGWCKTCWTK